MAFTANGCLYLDGGIGSQGEIEGRIWCINLDTMNVSETSMSDHPALAFHSCVSLHDDNFTFDTLRRKRARGAFAGSVEGLRKIIGSQNLHTERIEDVARLANTKDRVGLPEKLGHPAKPSARRAIYVFGGISPEFVSVNTLRLYLFDKEWSVRVVKSDGLPPTPRHSCGMAYIPSVECLAIHGGETFSSPDSAAMGPCYNSDLHLFQVQRNCWIRIRFSEQGLADRTDFSMAVCRNDIIVFGGLNKQNHLSGKILRLELQRDQTARFISIFNH